MTSRGRVSQENRTGKPLQLYGSNRTARSCLDSERKPVFGMNFSPKNQARVSVGNAYCFAQVTLAEAHCLQSDLELAECSRHAFKFEAAIQTCQAPNEGGISGQVYNPGMSQWAYRDVFDEDYRAFRKASGWTLQQVADFLGVVPGTVDTWRRKVNGTTPSKEKVYKIAELFQKSPFRYMDDERAVMNLDGSEALNPINRHMFGRLIQSVSDPDLTQDDIDILFEDFIRDAHRRAALNRKRGK